MQPDAPSMNGSVQKDSLDLTAQKRSVQEIPPAQGPFYNDASSSLLFMAQIADEFIPWGTSIKERDRQLRSFIPKEFRFNSALGIVSSANAAFSWKIEGPEEKAKNFQQRLQQSNFGRGWANLITQITIDLSTQDHGAFVEVIRAGDSPESDFIGLAHLDAARCWPTGIPEEPVWYQDRLGKFHRLKWWQVIHILDMEATYEGMPGLGYCALTRLLLACRSIRDISIYLQEKVGGRNTRAVTLVKGVTAQSIQEAWEKARVMHDSAGMYRYSMPLMLSSVSPNADIGFETLEIASLPDGFNLDLSEKQYVAQLAMAFQRDYQDFAPLPGGNLGTSQQSEILHAKSRGKGPGLFMKLIAEAINFYVLPDDLEFKWDEQDVNEDKAEADVRNVRGLDRKQRIESGELTPQVARMIALRDGDITQEEYDELKKQEEEQAQQQAVAALDQQVMGELGSVSGPESPDVPVQEGEKPTNTNPGTTPVQEQQKAQDDRAGTPKIEAERLAIEGDVTSAVAQAFTLAKERFSRVLGVQFEEKFNESDWVRNQGRFADYVGQGGGHGGGSAGAAAAKLLTKAAKEEKSLTPALQGIAKANRGQMAGLDYRLKTQESLTRKIAGDAKEKNLSFDAAASKIGDSVRYTMVFPEGRYSAGVNSAMKDVLAQGYTIKPGKFKNTWNNDEYRGINVSMLTPSGHTFELQFHTPASYYTKEALNHKFYDIAREPEKYTSSQVRDAHAQMRANTRKVAPPQELSKIHYKELDDLLLLSGLTSIFNSVKLEVEEEVRR